jgi:hypothetical protein
MKTITHLMNRFSLAASALAIAGMLALPGSLAAQEKGATQLTRLNTAKSAASAKPAGKTMACPQCQDSPTTVSQGYGKTGPERKLAQRHACPTCKTTLATAGQGKAAATQVNHTCGQSGGQSESCAMK